MLPSSGSSFCRVNNGLNSNSFPIINISVSSYINVAFVGKKSIGIGPNNHYQIFQLTPDETPAQLIINDPATNQQIFNGLISDMVGLICDSTQCNPWS